MIGGRGVSIVHRLGLIIGFTHKTCGLCKEEVTFFIVMYNTVIGSWIDQFSLEEGSEKDSFHYKVYRTTTLYVQDFTKEDLRI